MSGLGVIRICRMMKETVFELELPSFCALWLLWVSLDGDYMPNSEQGMRSFIRNY